ncbi:MAG: hypothetical protein RL497_764, partial [Pseudomonadota bacterium]
MNIVKAIKSKIASFTKECNQAESEKLIELATFFYKVDMRISQGEQEYIVELLEGIEWSSPINIESYQEKCISKINVILGGAEDQILVYLSSLMEEISDLGA